MKRFTETSTCTKLIAVLAGLLVALLFFWLGTLVGYRQAEYSSRWAGHYTEVFGGPHSPFEGRQGADDLVASNGAAGTVIAVNLPTIAVKNPNEAEKVIVIGASTVIRKFRSPATTTDIHPGDFLITVGTPDEDGRIVASFVRIMPPPSTTSPMQNQ